MDKKLVIIAEDEEAYGKILEDALIREGCYVLKVYNGDELITFAKSRQPELIILDLVMPIKNGFEVLTEMKKDDDLKHIKIIALSNLSQEADITKAKTLGADDYIVKSDATFYHVIDRIKKLLN